MLFHVDMIYLAKQAKCDVEKSFALRRNQIELRTGFLHFYIKTKKVCRCFASFSSEQEHFTHGMYMTALIRSSDFKKIEPIMFYEGINTKVFRRSIDFAIALVVTSRSSSFVYTINRNQ